MIVEIITWLLISYAILFVLSQILHDNSIVDIFWGLGFFQVTAHSIYLSGTLLTSQIILLIVVGLWALRLTTYITYKRIKRRDGDRFFCIGF
jgi:steroid 5-alpha reductase family enzyme